jgi:hypothetical protein
MQIADMQSPIVDVMYPEPPEDGVTPCLHIAERLVD